VRPSALKSPPPAAPAGVVIFRRHETTRCSALASSPFPLPTIPTRGESARPHGRVWHHPMRRDRREPCHHGRWPRDGVALNSPDACWSRGGLALAGGQSGGMGRGRYGSARACTLMRFSRWTRKRAAFIGAVGSYETGHQVE
jgi:hypothetical protein